MNTAQLVQHSSLGFKARKVRLALRLTRRELAVLTGITESDIMLFERNLPVRLDARRRIIKELWAIKFRNSN